MPPNLTSEQKRRLAILEPALRLCVPTGNLEKAKVISAELQLILKPTGHVTRLLQAKNWLYETAIEAGSLTFAKSGFSGTRQLVSKGTRTYVEATALLAICHLRDGEIDVAKRLIQEAIEGLPRISSAHRRRQFHARLLGRLEEECILAGLASISAPRPTLDAVDALAIELVRKNSPEQLTLLLGDEVPHQTIELLKGVRSSYEKRLPAPDRKLLPTAASDDTQREAIGKKAHAAVKRIAWRALCDPSHYVHQGWTQGLAVVYDKKYITAAILAAFGSASITATMGRLEKPRPGFPW